MSSEEVAFWWCFFVHQVTICAALAYAISVLITSFRITLNYMEVKWWTRAVFLEEKGGEAERITSYLPVSVGGKNKLSITVSAIELFFIFVELYFPSSEFRWGSYLSIATHKGRSMPERNATKSNPSIPKYDQTLHPTTVMYCKTKIKTKKKKGEPSTILIISRLQTCAGTKFYVPLDSGICIQL
jgi:hypothetical protein